MQTGISRASAMLQGWKMHQMLEKNNGGPSLVPDLSWKVHKEFFAPFLNATVFRLMDWFYSGLSMKSVAELQSLVDNVLLAPDFKISDLSNFNSQREFQRLNNIDADSDFGLSSPLTNQNGWKQSSIKIKLPAEKVHKKKDDAPILEVPDICHRSLLKVVTTALQDNSAKMFHFTLFSLYWQPTPESTPQRLYSEIYNLDAFIEEHARIKQLPPEPGSQYENAVAAIMVWSDGTQLGQFGSASLCPIYAYFRNQSKYDWAKPSQFAAHHITYIPPVCPIPLFEGFLS
jgi:hypothetical protein